MLQEKAPEAVDGLAEPPAPEPRQSRTDATVAAAYVVLTYALAFPASPARLATHIPGDSGDNLLNLWIVRWTGRNLLDWSSLWDTPIFWPHRNTLAYSESLLPVALVHRVLREVVRSDVVAFNLLHLGAWFASMWCTYLLARRLTGSTGGAFVAGLVFTLATPRLGHYGHFQLSMAFLLPVAVLVVIRFFDRPSVARGAQLGALTAVTSMAASYVGVMLVLMLAVVVPAVAIARRHVAPRATVAGLAAAGICAVALVAPVALQYTELQRDPHFRRDLSTSLDARADDFLRVVPENRVLSEIEPFASRSVPDAATIENRLFPGVVALALAGTGSFVLVRHRNRVRGRRPLETTVFVALLGAGSVLLLLAFGAEIAIGGLDLPAPWRAVRRLPGFTGIRAPARFVVVTQLAIAVLAAVGAAHLLTRLRVRQGVAVVVLLTAVIVGESALDVHLARVPSAASATAVNRELATREAAPVVELPIGSALRGWTWGYVEVPRQYLALIDGNPRVGGYSGFAPPGYESLALTLDTFPSGDAFAALTELGVRYVVLRVELPGPLEPWQQPYVEEDGVGRFAEETADAIVASLTPERAVSAERYGDAWLIEIAR